MCLKIESLKLREKTATRQPPWSCRMIHTHKSHSSHSCRARHRAETNPPSPRRCPEVKKGQTRAKTTTQKIHQHILRQQWHTWPWVAPEVSAQPDKRRESPKRSTQRFKIRKRVTAMRLSVRGALVWPRVAPSEPRSPL